MTMKFAALLLGTLALSGCVTDGLTAYNGDPNTVIATGKDKGSVDKTGLINGQAAIAYDPDGCQVWIMDDGVEGYSSPRYDPVSGLPVCNNLYPPGTVVKNYQTSGAGLRDYVPGPGRKTVVVKK